MNDFLQLRFAKITEANKLTSVMVGALHTGRDGKEMQAGTAQLKALSERGLMDSDTRTLTSRGYLILRALDGEEISKHEEADLFSVSVSSARYFVDWTDEAEPKIRPWSEDSDETWVSLIEAKNEIVEYAAAKRDRFREMIKDVRALRAKDVVSTEEEWDGVPQLDSGTAV